MSLICVCNIQIIMNPNLSEAPQLQRQLFSKSILSWRAAWHWAEGSSGRTCSHLFSLQLGAEQLNREGFTLQPFGIPPEQSRLEIETGFDIRFRNIFRCWYGWSNTFGSIYIFQASHIGFWKSWVHIQGSAILNYVGVLTVEQDIGHPASCWRESFRTSGPGAITPHLATWRQKSTSLKPTGDATEKIERVVDIYSIQRTITRWR